MSDEGFARNIRTLFGNDLECGADERRDCAERQADADQAAYDDAMELKGDEARDEGRPLRWGL